MSRHEVILSEGVKVIVGHENDTPVQHPQGTALGGPMFCQLFVGEDEGEPTAHIGSVAHADDILDWLEGELDERDLLPETEDEFETWMTQVCSPLMHEGKEKFNLQAAAAIFNS